MVAGALWGVAGALSGVAGALSGVAGALWALAEGFWALPECFRALPECLAERAWRSLSSRIPRRASRCCGHEVSRRDDKPPAVVVAAALWADEAEGASSLSPEDRGTDVTTQGSC